MNEYILKIRVDKIDIKVREVCNIKCEFQITINKLSTMVFIPIVIFTSCVGLILCRPENGSMQDLNEVCSFEYFIRFMK